MATIDKRTGQDGKIVYRVRVRRKGYALQVTGALIHLNIVQNVSQLCRFVPFQRQLLTTAILEGVVHEHQALLRLLFMHFDP